MQADFHHDATYALARAAGLTPEAAATIAAAAQYVDEATASSLPPAPDGVELVPEVTAHTLLDVRNTQVVQHTRFDDQRSIWIPFHFLPGGRGGTLSERLVCEMDSVVARELVAWALRRVTEPFGLELLGTVAHTYADTFAHRGFSGVSSRRNRIVPSSVRVHATSAEQAAILDEVFPGHRSGEESGLLPNFRKLVGAILNAGALGHGAVERCPDQPYLVWSFEYLEFDERPRTPSGNRDNPVEYLAAAERLHAMFVAARRSAEASLGDPAGARPFADIADVIGELISTVADCERRAGEWRRAAAEGRLYHGDDPIPEHGTAAIDGGRETLCAMSADGDVRGERLYRFYQAAAVQRCYVLRELLPRHGVVLI